VEVRLSSEVLAALLSALITAFGGLLLYLWQRREEKIGKEQELAQSIGRLSTDLAERHYAELDRLHFELLRMRIVNPQLAPKAFVQTDNEDADLAEARREYGCLVWSLIESIIDYCDKPGRNLNAWGPCVEYESTAYRAWLTPENLKRFEPGFVGRVDRLIATYHAEIEGGTVSPSRE
jgi:hypothetical protein